MKIVFFKQSKKHNRHQTRRKQSNEFKSLQLKAILAKLKKLGRMNFIENALLVFDNLNNAPPPSK